VEFLDSTDVGDGLTAFAADKRLLEVGRRIDPDLDLGVRDDRRPVDVDGVPEQQLGVEAGRLRARGTEALDALTQELVDGRHVRGGW
jgi:hypothetical protein